MKFSENWLREWVNPAISREELMAQVTMAGLEVDEFFGVANEFSGVVVGEITEAVKHPNADKLRVCQVSDGVDVFQVVCGAPNARAGIKVAFAKIGAVLGDDFKIKKAKLRQVESMGMLCSASELGLSDENDGIVELSLDAPLGSDVRQYLDLNDLIIDVDLTPNRSDCLSIAGLAREVGVLNKQDVKAVEISVSAVEVQDTFPVTVVSVEGCPRYLGRVIKDVDVSVVTPIWMVEKLRRCGVRSVDPIVDITNYVMLELGQPMHAFDLDKLSGAIVVRMADEGEKITLLDGQEISLRSDTLVIADESRPLAIAGVMGGENSGVSSETKDIFLESAFFTPLVLAGKARSYGLHTDSSHRFERGVDFQLQLDAIERATALIIEISGGKVGPVVDVTTESELPSRSDVVLRRKKLDQYLAISLDSVLVTGILQRLGLNVVRESAEEWVVSVPSHRFDISIEADLIEEVARVYGYDNLPSSMPTASIGFSPVSEAKTSLQTMRSTLVAFGYQEAVTYSFIDPAISSRFYPEIEAIKLENPISVDMGVMRPSIIPGLVKAYLHNQNRQQSRVRLFETGRRFIGSVDALAEMDQQERLSGLIAGSKAPESWCQNNDKVDFYDIKSHLDGLFALNSSEAPEYRKANEVFLHPGRSAEVLISGKVVGIIGELHPQLSKSLGCSQSVYVFDVSLDAVLSGRLPRYKAISKFPEVRRDLALLMDRDIAASSLKDVILSVAGEGFKDVTVFDVYQGQGIDDTKKSIAIGLTWQHPSHTLSDEEINNSLEVIVNELYSKLGAVVRG
ncbi:phenylalanine--tRNA ligase subunit beta [Marinomonas sp. 2405UD68-3]|uniref:phenylalanine--tRNA ligase subunit beta n=1 Tax=Marinomonas sp. 2405UD68-3 TaxID=3391835 RepID=UPI0039C8F005